MFQTIVYIAVSLALVQAEYKFETKWFRVPLDHFSFQRNETFEIKYLVNDDNWDQGSGPIFFYTGNEGQIEVFAKHTGFMWEIAKEYRAKLVFAEHRYYGASMPFGNKSLDNEHIGYLSSAQALADYADLINYLQGNAIKPRYPVVAFGGSYGGMLAAYFRIKYPHIVAGAIAASAPVHMFTGMTPCGVFNRLVTSSFRTVDTHCSSNIKQSWSVIRQYSSTANGSEALRKAFNLCTPVKNATELDVLMEFLQSMYSSLAMVNYPFASDFLTSLPAEPVRVVCQYLNQTLTGDKLLEAIGKVIDIYTNYDKKNKCVDFMKGDDYGNLDAAGWDFQACTEMVMPMCANGENDMFEPDPWNYTKFANDCHKKYNVYPRVEMARLEYGGNRLHASSNIVFSNGLRDPWTGGGILDSLNESVRAVVIVDAAHHLDLMPSNPSDPEPVKIARNIHKQHISRWIQDFRDQMVTTRRY